MITLYLVGNSVIIALIESWKEIFARWQVGGIRLVQYGRIVRLR